NGALETLGALRDEIGRRGLEINVEQTGGWGLNFADPVVEVRTPDGERLLYGNVSAEDVPAFVDAALVSRQGREHWLLGALHGHAGDHVGNMTDHAWWSLQERRLMADMGIIDPEEIDDAIARGAYAGLAKALTLSQEEVIAEVTGSKLGGRSGGFFPTGRK